MLDTVFDRCIIKYYTWHGKNTTLPENTNSKGSLKSLTVCLVIDRMYSILYIHLHFCLGKIIYGDNFSSDIIGTMSQCAKLKEGDTYRESKNQWGVTWCNTARDSLSKSGEYLSHKLTTFPISHITRNKISIGEEI